MSLDPSYLPFIVNLQFQLKWMMGKFSRKCARWFSSLHVKVACLCLLWYSASSAGGVIEKLLLSNMPYPMTVAMCQLFSIATYLPPLLYLWGVPSDEHTISKQYFLKWIIPLSIGKFVSMFSARVSIWKVPVSFAHTVKATLPLFTILISRFVLKEHHTKQVYASLFIIVSGVVIATATELSFNIVGFLSALLSTLVFTIQNIYSKKVLKETGVHHLRLLLLLTRISILISLPVWIYFDAFSIAEDVMNPASEIDWSRALLFLFADGVCNFIQNKVAFSLIALLSSIGYAVTNSSKRVAVIIISIMVLRNPVTSSNAFGMGLAITGVFFYNKAKYDESRANQILPKHDGNNQELRNGGQVSPEVDTPSGWVPPLLKTARSYKHLVNDSLLPNEYSFADLPQAAAASRNHYRTSGRPSVVIY